MSLLAARDIWRAGFTGLEAGGGVVDDWGAGREATRDRLGRGISRVGFRREGWKYFWWRCWLSMYLVVQAVDRGERNIWWWWFLWWREKGRVKSHNSWRGQKSRQRVSKAAGM